MQNYCQGLDVLFGLFPSLNSQTFAYIPLISFDALATSSYLLPLNIYLDSFLHVSLSQTSFIPSSWVLHITYTYIYVPIFLHLPIYLDICSACT